MAGKKKKKASAPAESPTNVADNAHPLFEFIEEEETVEPLVDPLTAVDLMDTINPLNTMTAATSNNNLMDLQMDDWLPNAASFPQPVTSAHSIIPAPSSSNTPLSSLPFTSFGTLSSGLSSQSHNSASLFDAPSESFSFSQTPKHNNSLSVLRDSLRASTDSESAHSQQHASANLLDLSPVDIPISSNSKMLHIPLETGSIDISLDDVASKLDRLERLQSMFKELEARHKQLSVSYVQRQCCKCEHKEASGNLSLLHGVKRECRRGKSFLNDSQLKVKEAALLKDRVKELEIQGKKVFELQAKVSDQEEQIKLLKSQASSASSPQRNGSMDASKPTVNTASVTNSPSHPTPPAAPSFFNFQTLLPTVKSNLPAITTPTATSAVSNAANSDTASPVSPQESTEKSASAVSTLQMKLKLRDLANALKRVTEQRDVAVSRIKELQDAAEISHTSNPSALSITHQSDRRSSVDELIVGIPNSAKSDANSSPLVLVDLVDPFDKLSSLRRPFAPAISSPKNCFTLLGDTMDEQFFIEKETPTFDPAPPLLEKQEELKDIEARHAESVKKVEACEARITLLEKDARLVEDDEKNSVEKELGAIDGTLESDLENMKRLKKLEIEKVLGLQLERGLEAQREEWSRKVESLQLSLLNLKAANDKDSGIANVTGSGTGASQVKDSGIGNGPGNDSN
ncbi:hypothetical protein HDU78_011470 [Chytriomyces hyalinus]|nr:hypothetical protein HDU78_011470 [Chytriomyces hyalinus]